MEASDGLAAVVLVPSTARPESTEAEFATQVDGEGGKDFQELVPPPCDHLSIRVLPCFPTTTRVPLHLLCLTKRVTRTLTSCTWLFEKSPPSTSTTEFVVPETTPPLCSDQLFTNLVGHDEEKHISANHHVDRQATGTCTPCR